MFGFRFIGWLLILPGCLMLFRDVFAGLTAGLGFRPNTVTDLWNYVSPGMADAFSGSVLQHFGRLIWYPFAVFLNIWGFAIFLIPGIILEFFGRPTVDQPHKRARRSQMPPRY